MTSKPLFACTWQDAHGSSTSSAYSEHEIPHAAILITSYGLLLRQDDSGVSIASESCADGTYRGVTFIPRVLIVELRPLEKPKRVRATKAAQSVKVETV
jgi:hypothetical protein